MLILLEYQPLQSLIWRVAIKGDFFMFVMEKRFNWLKKNTIYTITLKFVKKAPLIKLCEMTSINKESVTN